MSFDDNNFEEFDEGPLPEEENNNRTFLVAVGILGGIILISIACLVGVYLFGNRGGGGDNAQAAADNATQTAIAEINIIDNALTATAQASILPTNTLPPSPTAVVNVATETATVDPAIAEALEAGTPAAATATVGAALTQAAIAQLTVIPTTTGLPQTGLVDDIGVPGLAAMALAFVIVILLARRLRTVPVSNR